MAEKTPHHFDSGMEGAGTASFGGLEAVCSYQVHTALLFLTAEILLIKKGPSLKQLTLRCNQRQNAKNNELDIQYLSQLCSHHVERVHAWLYFVAETGFRPEPSCSEAVILRDYVL